MIRAGAAAGGVCGAAAALDDVDGFDGAGAVTGSGAAGAGAAGAGAAAGVAAAGGTAAGAGVGAVVMPGIGELPGGTTGRWELPAGRTGVAGEAVGDALAVIGDSATPGVVGAAGCGVASTSLAIVTGGPVNAMLLCVPM